MFLEVSHIVKNYQLGETVVPALRDVSLSIQRGEFTGLVGTSGSGKSTFLNMIGCIDYPDAGSIRLEGQELTVLSEDERSDFRNRRIGFIFQSFNLLPVLSVQENVELPLLVNDSVPPKERGERVRQALLDVGLEKFATQRPERLSGGQRQRVAIARALVTNPAFILADEPTANLDSVTAHSIIDLMLKLNAEKGVTFLFSTHDEKLISRVRRLLHMNDGKIREA
jgi:putative ABC transport system ATP-binding protein